MIIALCDTNLLGRKFEEGQKQLDLSGTFFRGEEKTRGEVVEVLEDTKMEDATYNIVGQESCDLAKELKIISSKDIFYIGGVPLAVALS